MPAVAGHADLSLLHAGGNTFFVTQSIQAFSDVLAPFGAHVEYAEKKSGLSYPDDAFLNLCILGDYVIANEKSADKHVLDWLLRKRRLISVRQGYARYATCILDSDHIVTAHPEIHAAVRRYGIESLLIQPGGVSAT